MAWSDKARAAALEARRRKSGLRKTGRRLGLPKGSTAAYNDKFFPSEEKKAEGAAWRKSLAGRAYLKAKQRNAAAKRVLTSMNQNMDYWRKMAKAKPWLKRKGS